MTRRIRVNFMSDPTVINAVQIGHHQDLFLSFLLPTIEAARQYGDDTLLEDTYLTWAKTEFCRYAYVATYHFWEKQIDAFMRDQCGRVGVRWPPRGNDGLVTQVRHVLIQTFAIDTDNAIADELEAARAFTNAIKHGGPKARQLHIDYPRFFPAGTDDARQDDLWAWAEVTKADIDKLCEAIAKFWDDLGTQVDRAFTVEEQE